jgi:integrase
MVNTKIPITAEGGREEAEALLAIARDGTKARLEVKKHYKTNSPLTLAEYVRKTWLPLRQVRANWKDDESRLNQHILPELGAVPLAEISRRHLKRLLAALQTKRAKVQVAAEGPDGKPTRRAGDKPLSAGTIRNIMVLASGILADAEDEELIPIAPRLRKGSLPPKEDADPAWRETAIFDAGEVATLIGDDRIPLDRRALYAIMFLGGMRFGEAAALRWWMFEPAPEMDRLKVLRSYSTRLKREKATKTRKTRVVPVHSALAVLLRAWREHGWLEQFGRAPTPEDLIVPSRGDAANGRQPGNRSANHMLKKFHLDCVRMGLRPRRQHDARRTFRTLAVNNGGDPTWCRWITHGRPGDVDSLYTEAEWRSLCAVVRAIPVGIPTRAAA